VRIPMPVHLGGLRMSPARKTVALTQLNERR
jgi:hypothetical protein